MEKKHDCMFILGNGSLNGKNEEMKVAVASLRKFCSSWVRNIYVVGENPNIDGVIHVPAKDEFVHDKDANIIHKVRIGCYIKGLTDDFLMCSDDQLVTMESSWSDFRPRYLDILGDMKDWKWKKTIWQQRMTKCLMRFGRGAKYFQPHIFSPINKIKFADMCNKVAYEVEDGVTIFSLYYNWIKEKGVENFDHKMISGGGHLPSGVRHIGYVDNSFKDNVFRTDLENLLDIKLSR